MLAELALLKAEMAKPFTALEESKAELALLYAFSAMASTCVV